ncbi:MATH domain and coiled-coil domain-containing protein At3g58250-like [Prosopis cineraria]|uniref:MATH domain and coiled-coil domain-containing protein At3g58250-like n=1 Tax=Prosopis cineraria TaxID=364024 RepID=UPI0024105AA2|nr:MATH domain and coiled-coil domain-containing protein At3g58250-like [Prosopis cineraria]
MVNNEGNEKKWRSTVKASRCKEADGQRWSEMRGRVRVRYLVDDSCVFGAEVFVVQCSGNWECLSTLDDKFKDSYTWNLSKYSQIVEAFCDSEAFSIKGKTWKLRVYPRGDRSPKNEFLSIFLVLNEDESSMARKKWFAEYTLHLKNQSAPSRTRELNGASWFSHVTNKWGFS